MEQPSLVITLSRGCPDAGAFRFGEQVFLQSYKALWLRIRKIQGCFYKEMWCFHAESEQPSK